jgi:hypothetical protein
MAKPAPRTMRDLRIAARDGDPAAIRALLRKNDREGMAKEVRRGKPIPPRVRTMVGALTAGTGTRDELGAWEALNKRGEIVNDLQLDPVIFKE